MASKSDPLPSGKLKWTNIGVMLHETSEFRRLIGVGISSDGGVMLSPSKYLGLNGWVYGVANVPGRYSKRKIGFISSEDVVSIQETPKMHFHKSGEAAISLTGRRIERRNVQYQHMEKFRGEQFFSLNVDRPDLLPLSRPKAKDIMLFAHGSLPAAIGVCGFLCPKRRLKKLSVDFFTTGNGIGFLPDGDTETIVIDLSPQGIDFYFSLPI